MFNQLLTQPSDISNYWQYFALKNSIIAATALLISLISMKFFLKIINEKNICLQPIRKDGPQTHIKEKKNTPTMGGLIIILATILTSIIWIDLKDNYVIATLFVFLSFCLIGFIDDFIKIKGQNTNGFKGSIKLILGFVIVGATLIFLQSTNPIYLSDEITIPFINLSIDIGQFYTLFAIIVVVGSANSVNLTDGLDGLVSVPAVIALISLIMIAGLTNNSQLAQQFNVSFIKNSANSAFLSSALIGSILGFLKYNLKPAKIFMGDVGSLGIGAMLGITAIILKIELIFFIIALLFVIEATSVILQVASFKIRKKRIFLMAPIHHHFEKLGWKEVKVVKVFWLASLIFAIIGLLGIIV
jgi:phospho-N-acetylmuramoyl-pentapeptide-transferase